MAGNKFHADFLGRLDECRDFAEILPWGRIPRREDAMIVSLRVKVLVVGTSYK